MNTTNDKVTSMPPVPPVFVPGSAQWQDASDKLFEAWKQQADAAIRFVDAAVQGTLEMRSSQLAAAMETHAEDLDAEHSLQGAKTIADLWAIQLKWAVANLERSIAYWSHMMKAANDAGANVLQCMRDQAQALGTGKADEK